jgi:hypothetical protein
VLGLVLLVLTATGIIWSSAHGVWGWYERTYNWRKSEYRKLSELRAGYTIGKFDELLGAPAFARSSYNRKWLEYTYEGRGYWVQSLRQSAE